MILPPFVLSFLHFFYDIFCTAQNLLLFKTHRTSGTGNLHFIYASYSIRIFDSTCSHTSIRRLSSLSTMPIFG